MMRTEEGLFEALENELKKAKEPMDCHMLFEKPGVREHATSANRVSDYLGNLWRKGKVTRLPAPRLEGTRARWLYVWKERQPTQLKKSVDYDVDRGIKLVDKPTLEISDDGGVITIDTLGFTLILKPKKLQ